MKRLLLIVLAMALLVAGRRNTARSDEDPASAASQTAMAITSVELSQCLVSPIEDVQVAALEAGQLRELRVREGAEVFLVGRTESTLRAVADAIGDCAHVDGVPVVFAAKTTDMAQPDVNVPGSRGVARL